MLKTLTVLFTLSLGAQAAHAAVVTYQFSGTITAGGGSGMFNNIAIGDTFAGRFSFDDAVPDSTGFPNISNFATGSLQATIDGVEFKFTTPPDEKFISVFTQSPLWFLKNEDKLGNPASQSSANGVPLTALIASLTFSTAQANDDIYPDIPPLPNTSMLLFLQGEIRNTQNQVTDQVNVNGTFDTIQLAAVPVPAGIILTATAFGALSVARRIGRTAASPKRRPKTFW